MNAIHYFNKKRKIILPICFGIIFIISWQLLSDNLHVPVYILPSPKIIIREIINNFNYISYHLLMTVKEAICGLVISIILGLALSFTFVFNENLEKILFPYFIASQSIPIVAIAPLFILWFGNGIMSKIAMSTLMCFFPITVNTVRGLRSVTQDQIDLFKIHSSSEWNIFFKLRFPSSLAQIFTGVKVSSSLAMIGAIVAEYSGSDRGIGYVIMQSTYRLDTPGLFAGIIVSCIVAIFLFFIIVFIEKIFFSKYSFMN